LKNLIERSVILGEFPEEFAGQGTVTGKQAIENLDLVMQRHIMNILDDCRGNRAEAARRLGVSRKTIDRKLALWSGDVRACAPAFAGPRKGHSAGRVVRS
jgi:DNA-binding NtrC family response regulator